MTKIYTKTGDQGSTSLVGGQRVSKSDERVEAYGTVDELMSFMALLSDHMRTDAGLKAQVDEFNHILSQLMTVAALLATGRGGECKVGAVDVQAVAWLEGRIDEMQTVVPPITKFTIPGGHVAVSLSHVCRTVCRRAERAALRANAIHGVDPTALAYLNRLSDYLYLLGRLLTTHFDVEESLWIP